MTPYIWVLKLRHQIKSLLFQDVTVCFYTSSAQHLWSFATLGLNDFEDGGTNILRNTENCSPDNMASQPTTRTGLSATPEPQISQLQTNHFDKELQQNITVEYSSALILCVCVFCYQLGHSFITLKSMTEMSVPCTENVRIYGMSLWQQCNIKHIQEMYCLFY